MDEKMVAQLRLLKKYTDFLKQIRRREKAEYLKDNILQGAAERYLQLSIESCINIGNRILSFEQMEHNIDIPETYADIFKNMANIGIIEKEFSDRLIKMAKFRNRLVHVYWDLDSGQIYEIIRNNIDDFDKFLKATANYIDRKRGKEYMS